MKKFYLILIAFTMSLFTSSAQKVKTVNGEYIYYPPSTQSFEEARQTALYRAQMQILADTFGTMMNMSSATVIRNSADNSDVNSYSLGESSVKGEWLETVGEPEFITSVTEQGMLAIKVRVTGKVREITVSKADFEVKVLRNGTEDRFESNEFHEGDDMFVSFCGSADGYITIYLYDGGTDVYCLMPYQQQRLPVIKVEGGTRYVFFSSRHAYYGVPESVIDEYNLTCSNELEINRLYFIWSPDSYYKAVDSFEAEGIPRVLDQKNFQNWLTRLRVQNNSITVKTIDITIKKNR